MIVFACWPTADVPRSNETAKLWMSLGYKVAVATDLPSTAIKGIAASIPPLLIQKWTGYYACVNFMARSLCVNFGADIVVCAGDGILPDPQRRGHDMAITFAAKFPNGYGVMQPTAAEWQPTISGDRAQPGVVDTGRRMHATPCSRERCESPWIGRRFILDSYNGNGPYSEKYFQYFGDQELMAVARRTGSLWVRPDARHESIHWSHPGGPSMKPYQRANFDNHYEKDFGVYRARLYKQFPEEVEMVSAPDEPKLILP